MPDASVTMVIPGSTIVIGTLGKVDGITVTDTGGDAGTDTGGDAGTDTGGLAGVTGVTGVTGLTGLTGGLAGGVAGSTWFGLSTIHKPLTISFSKFMRQIYKKIDATSYKYFNPQNIKR